MNLNSVQGLFNYLNSFEKVSIRLFNNLCNIFLPNGIVLHGKAVDQIDYSSNNLIDHEYSFIYTNDKIANIESFRMIELQLNPESFLEFMYNLCPEIIPIEYRLNQQLSYFEQAIREMQVLRIQIGKFKSAFDEVQNKMFKLQSEKESFDGTLSELTEKCSRKSSQLAEAWIPLIKSDDIINVLQMKAIHSFVKNDVGSNIISINTGYQDNTVKLNYLITRWGSADLEGIPVGSDNEFTFFNKNGQQTAEVPRSSGLSISIEWDVLLILLEHFESKV
jgi:predicted CopG family antitoxin